MRRLVIKLTTPEEKGQRARPAPWPLLAMAHLHFGGSSAPGSGGGICPVCQESGQVIGLPCWSCGASVDQSALGAPEEEQLGQAGTLADGTALRLVRPLSDGSNMNRAELSRNEEEHMAATGLRLAMSLRQRCIMIQPFRYVGEDHDGFSDSDVSCLTVVVAIALWGS
eukprot:2777010-Alexandrium_andersonii.AAC.1